MQQLRCEIDGDMEDMAASARTMVDWKHYVKTYPWVCLGTAAALGFLIVPKRSTAINADSATPAELAKTGHRVVNSAPATGRGWVDSLVAAVVSIAVFGLLDISRYRLGKRGQFRAGLQQRRNQFVLPDGLKQIMLYALIDAIDQVSPQDFFQGGVVFITVFFQQRQQIILNHTGKMSKVRD